MRKRGIKSRIRIWFLRKSTQKSLQAIIQIALGVATVIIIVAAALHLPFISVQSIAIAPESDIDQTVRVKMLAYAEKILSSKVYGVPGKTRYFFKKQEFENMLRTNFLQVDGLSIKSSFLNKWHIVARKRTSFGTHCHETRCFVVDTMGVVFMETDIQIGPSLTISSVLHLGDQIFNNNISAITDFQKIPEVVGYLEDGGFLVKKVSLRQDTKIVHIELENGIGIWIDVNESTHDTTRALHIVFEEVFSDPEKQAGIISIDVRNPLSILYEKI